MHLANNIAQTPCSVCANAVERDGAEVCAAADSLVRLTRIPEIMQDFLEGECVCFERVVPKDDAWYNLKDDHSLSGPTIKITEAPCVNCCKSEVHIVFRGSTLFRAVVCDYNYPDDPGILHCVMKGECPYFSPTSTKRVVGR